MDKIFENMRVSALLKLVLAVDNLIRTDSSEIFVLISYILALYMSILFFDCCNFLQRYLCKYDGL